MGHAAVIFNWRGIGRAEPDPVGRPKKRGFWGLRSLIGAALVARSLTLSAAPKKRGFWGLRSLIGAALVARSLTLSAAPKKRGFWGLRLG
jgi:hypothetical protein